MEGLDSPQKKPVATFCVLNDEETLFPCSVSCWSGFSSVFGAEEAGMIRGIGAPLP